MKVNERRIIPMCDALMQALTPWKQASGPVCVDKVPQREIEQIMSKVKKTLPKFRWKHNALRHSYGSYRTALITIPKKPPGARPRETRTLEANYSTKSRSFWRTTNTGHGANRTTRSAVLPIRVR